MIANPCHLSPILLSLFPKISSVAISTQYPCSGCNMKQSFSVFVAFLLGIYGCHWFCRTPSVNCSKKGSDTLFVANFQSDVVGSPPSSSTPLHYGPPGASLKVQPPGGAVVVSSTELGSKALRLSRQSSACVVDAVVGGAGDARYTAGVY